MRFYETQINNRPAVINVTQIDFATIDKSGNATVTFASGHTVTLEEGWGDFAHRLVASDLPAVAA